MNDPNSSHGELTATEFETLLRRLHPDRERAGEKYEYMRWQLRKFFGWNCGFPAEDLVDETLDRVARRLQELDVADVTAFAWGVARNVRLEASRKAARMVPIAQHPGDEGFHPTGADTEAAIHDKIESESLHKRLHICLQKLPPQERELFLAYHHPEGNVTEFRQKLAVRLGITLNALRVRVNRLRDKIERQVLGDSYLMKKQGI